jgi:hypothetical protein
MNARTNFIVSVSESPDAVPRRQTVGCALPVSANR